MSRKDELAARRIDRERLAAGNVDDIKLGLMALDIVDRLVTAVEIIADVIENQKVDLSKVDR